ncbi:hypothetical protein JM16_006945 [Phytophthora kernoviae]|uniref:Uncharacterized protein n=1 Tax=Phytophthora kernoviae TaxID=325452 RepID=A0A8T0LTY6_9STRA|nr:hypothetical protein JM16_006945 [Phytophthora kernoviae]
MAAAASGTTMDTSSTQVGLSDRLTAVKAVEGFFERKKSTESERPTLSLFKNFEMLPSSWTEFQEKLDHLQGRNVKVVFFVRHAQGFHNLKNQEQGIGAWACTDEFLDPDLTPLGIEDVKSRGPRCLKKELERGMPPVERVVVSPLSRAIQTAQHFFTTDQLPSAPFMCFESCREVFDCYTFDKRQPLSVIKQKFPDVDFSHVKDEEDLLWSSTRHETLDEIQTRAKVFLSELFDAVPDRYVVVISHVCFIQAVWAVTMGGSHPHPDNCEVGEILKKEQQYPLFKHRSPAFVFVVGNRMSAIITIQRLYRRYRRMKNWHNVGDHILQLARAQFAELRAQEEEDISAANFRALLADGFSASKVCISGGLKTIQLRVVLNSEAGECYLTWTPSRKKKPRIDLREYCLEI